MDDVHVSGLFPLGLRQYLWVRVVRKEEKNSGLKAVFS
jgi:hypothetical protein